MALQWRHNGPDCVSNHQHRYCLLKRLVRRRSKKTSKLSITGFCMGNLPVTGEFPAQMASNAENVFIWWRHYGMCLADILEIHRFGFPTSSGALTREGHQLWGCSRSPPEYRISLFLGESVSVSNIIVRPMNGLSLNFQDMSDMIQATNAKRIITIIIVVIITLTLSLLSLLLSLSLSLWLYDYQ